MSIAASEKKNPIRLIILILLSLLGLGASIYLAKHYYDVQAGATSFKSACNLGAKMNCDAVAASSYAELFAGIPLASFAAGWYLALLIVFGSALSRSVRDAALRTALGLTGFAAVISLFYLFVMAKMLGTYCLYCLVLDGVNIASFALVLSLKPGKPTLTQNFAITTVVALFVAVVGLKGLDQTNLKDSDAQLFAQSVLSSAPISVNSGPEYPSIGPKDAPVTVVEFSDFQCPYCRIGAIGLNSVMGRYAGKVRIVMRQYPLDQSCNRKVDHPMHTYSCEAARVALCANQQGKFQETYETIFENQESLAPGKAAELAKAAGVDGAKLDACLASKEMDPKVQGDIEEGIRLEVNSTPTFFINGHRVNGFLPAKSWGMIIDQLLKSPR